MALRRPVSIPIVVLLAACGVLSACSPGTSSPGSGQVAGDAWDVTAIDRVPASRRVVIAFLGDSLTAGLGLLSNQSYPSRIGEMFAAEGYDMVEILNAGVSGDTTAGAVRRLDQVLAPDVHILVVALGGNDVLRGLTVDQTHENLTIVIERAFESGAEVLLAGMEGPTNLGEDYRARFREVFIQLSREYQRRLTYVPFLLEGVAAQPDLNQGDGIHPNEQGARVIAEHLYPPLRNMVDMLPVLDAQ